MAKASLSVSGWGVALAGLVMAMFVLGGQGPAKQEPAKAAPAAPAAAAPSGPGFTLVADGKPQAALVLAKELKEQAAAAAEAAKAKGKKARGKGATDPLEDEGRTAAEIQSYVKKISGAELPIIYAGDDLGGLKPVFIGKAADEKLLDAVKAKGSDGACFTLVVTPQQASLRGLSSPGTYYAAMELLEQLGVRWFMPGDLGTVIPEAKTLVLKAQDTIQVPSFASRQLQVPAPGGWDTHLRAGGPRFPSSHGVNLGAKADALFQEHPEYFSLINGERKNKQLCVSNPEVVKLAIASTRDYFKRSPSDTMIGMGPNDGGGYCQCDKCKALDGGDYDPLGHYTSMTDRYLWFFNQILEGISDEFPDKRIGFYAYAAYNRVPVHPEKYKHLNQIVPAMAPITLCRMHGMGAPVCPEKNSEPALVGAWGKLIPQVYERGYWFNLADPGTPFFMVRRIAREVPLGKKLGVYGWRTECMTNWAGSNPSLYVALKLMWDHTASVDALVADFCEKFYGPAGKPMRQYIELMDKTVDEADYHTGGIWDMASVYNAKVRQQARALLDEAIKLAPPDSGVYGKRVDLSNQSFGFLEGFADVMEGRTVQDYDRAKKGLERMQAIGQLMVESRDPRSETEPQYMPGKCKDYTDRYLTDTVNQGYARVTGGNKLLAALKEDWQFQIDPESIGEALAWFNPFNVGGNWQQIKTCSSTWSDQGLRYYKGLAWYRQTVDIPAEAKDQRVFLWCGAVDEMAKVWVNGKEVGISPRAPFKPFEMDATEAIQAGKPNVVVICVSNHILNELGTGGIMGPVMLYIPAAGKDAKLETGGKEPPKVFPEY